MLHAGGLASLTLSNGPACRRLSNGHFGPRSGALSGDNALPWLLPASFGAFFSLVVWGLVLGLALALLALNHSAVAGWKKVLAAVGVLFNLFLLWVLAAVLIFTSPEAQLGRAIVF